MITKPDQKRLLINHIKQLRVNLQERINYLIKNPDAINYDEIARDKRALEIRINNRERELFDFDSKRNRDVSSPSVSIPLNYRHGRY